MEIRCCCTPENLIGHVPHNEGIKAGLELRELDDGSHAFSSEGVEIDQIPGFERDNRKGGKKTWRR